MRIEVALKMVLEMALEMALMICQQVSLGCDQFLAGVVGW